MLCRISGHCFDIKLDTGHQAKYPSVHWSKFRPDTEFDIRAYTGYEKAGPEIRYDPSQHRIGSFQRLEP